MPATASAQSLGPTLQKIKDAGTITIGHRTKIAQRDGRLVEMYLAVGVIYFLVCYTASQFVKRLQGRLVLAGR